MQNAECRRGNWATGGAGRAAWAGEAFVSRHAGRVVRRSMSRHPPGSALLGFVPLPPSLLGLIILITLIYVFSAEATKRFFYRER